jgi:hypothetical protein
MGEHGPQASQYIKLRQALAREEIDDLRNLIETIGIVVCELSN